MPKRLLNTSTLVGAGLGGATGLAINRLGLGNKSLLSNLLATAAGGTLGGALGYYINKNIEQDVANNAKIEAATADIEQKEEEKEKRESEQAVQNERINGSSPVGAEALVATRNVAKAVAGEPASAAVKKVQEAVSNAGTKVILESQKALNKAKKEYDQAAEGAKNWVSDVTGGIDRTLPTASQVQRHVPDNMLPLASAGATLMYSNKRKGLNAAEYAKNHQNSEVVTVGTYQDNPKGADVKISLDRFGNVRLDTEAGKFDIGEEKQRIKDSIPDKGSKKQRMVATTQARKELSTLIKLEKKISEIKTKQEKLDKQPIEISREYAGAIGKPAILIGGRRVNPQLLTPEEQGAAYESIVNMDAAVKNAAKASIGRKKKAPVEYPKVEKIGERVTRTGEYNPYSGVLPIVVSLPGVPKDLKYTLTPNGVPVVTYGGKEVDVSELPQRAKNQLYLAWGKDPRITTTKLGQMFGRDAGADQVVNDLKKQVSRWTKTRVRARKLARSSILHALLGYAGGRALQYGAEEGLGALGENIERARQDRLSKEREPLEAAKKILIQTRLDNLKNQLNK